MDGDGDDGDEDDVRVRFVEDKNSMKTRGPEQRAATMSWARAAQCAVVLATLAWALLVWRPIVAKELARTVYADGYSEALAEELVAYAAVVSCPRPETLEAWSCKMCAEGLAPIRAPPTLEAVKVVKDEGDVNQALVGYDERNARVVVSFRGSVAIAQWIFDLDVTPMHEYCHDCLVHQGFYFSWKDLREGVLGHVRELAQSRRVREVHLTGHSLGAAIAVHAGLALVQDGFSVRGYTFGQPRVGNAAFARHANAALPRWFRVVNYLDPVPQAPKLPLFYHHMATEVYYFERPVPGSAPGPYRVCSRDNGEDPACQDADCGGIKFCIDGQYHVTYMNLPGITNVSALC